MPGIDTNVLVHFLVRIYARGFPVVRAEVHHGLPWLRISDHAALPAGLELS